MLKHISVKKRIQLVRLYLSGLSKSDVSIITLILYDYFLGYLSSKRIMEDRTLDNKQLHVKWEIRYQTI